VNILLIEDEKSLADALAHLLKKSNYAVAVAHNGIEGQYLAETGVHDIIILDRLLPGKDGMAVLKSLRQSGISTPVLILTAKDSIQNRVEGLDGGADDYLVKPFSRDELLARLRALGRRHADIVFNNEIAMGNILFNPHKGEISCREQIVRLTVREVQLLEMLIKNRDLVLSKSQILEKVWGYDTEVDLNNVEVYLSYLRKKLSKLKGGVIIQTIWGIGYCLKEEV
jgi:DNA-binding response OmpR family regulator